VRTTLRSDGRPQFELTGAHSPGAVDRAAIGILALGFLSLAVPLFWDWSRGTYSSGAQGHELLVVGASAWLLYRKRVAIAALDSAPAPRMGAVLFGTGLLLYYFGSAYDLRLALLALVLLAAALLIRVKGFAIARVAWFPLVFPLFAAPLPLSLVLTLTGPLKVAVSAVATALLAWLGYDIGRSGVVVTIGQYQLLVTEACAGLQTMFTLEAMGLLYANLMQHASWLRNALLAALAVPIALAANVVRVMSLALVTYHLGDAAGQGFLHGLAGLVLFGVGLLLVIGIDWSLGKIKVLQG